MPTMRRKLTSVEVNTERGLSLAQVMTPAEYHKSPDVWIDRSGIVYYAGFWQHEESAKLLGFDTAALCEKSGYIHVTATEYKGKPQFLHVPRKITDRQYDTLVTYCEIHKIQNPALV